MEGPTAVRGRGPDRAHFAGSLVGEDIALVRPYVLAWENRERPRRSVVVTPHLPADAWSVIAGAR
ncbi:hypothetical protein ACFQ6S_19920 [Streptomyces sp. NPDC056479]|uniref:hypothetical protein n=1 Tax=Streptomyces sp. NPDC056479 TaxID=3345832 RepID=UPI0036786D81